MLKIPLEAALPRILLAFPVLLLLLLFAEKQLVLVCSGLLRLNRVQIVQLLSVCKLWILFVLLLGLASLLMRLLFIVLNRHPLLFNFDLLCRLLILQIFWRLRVVVLRLLFRVFALEPHPNQPLQQ